VYRFVAQSPVTLIISRMQASVAILAQAILA